MDPEDKKLLEQTYSLEKENNSMLRALKRSMFMAHVSRIVYWLVIIGISIGAYYFIQPYFDQLIKMYESVSSTFKNIQNLPK